MAHLVGGIMKRRINEIRTLKKEIALLESSVSSRNNVVLSSQGSDAGFTVPPNTLLESSHAKQYVEMKA